MQQTQIDHIHTAALLLKTVWNGIDQDYLSKYRMEIWRQYEENVAACARMTNDLTTLVSLLCDAFHVAVIGRNEKERLLCVDTLKGFYGDPLQILRVLREHPQVCVAVLRNMKDEEKRNAANADDEL